MRISDWSSDGCSSDLRLAQCIRPSHEHAECKLESQPAACSELWPVVDQPLSEWTPDTFAAGPNRGGPSVVAERHARIAARQQGIQFEDEAGVLGMMDADEENGIAAHSGWQMHLSLVQRNSTEERRVGQEGVRTCQSR